MPDGAVGVLWGLVPQRCGGPGWDSDVYFYPDEQQKMVRYLELADVPHR